MIEQTITTFFTLILEIKLYHWNTRIYSRHIATDSLFNTLLGLIDTFVEVYIGRYDRPSGESLHLKLKTYNDVDMKKLLESFTYFLKDDISKMLKASDTDLLNIRDEILAEVHKTLYLFTLQ
jgi:DNA-binding ferritin-like protein